MKRNQTKRLVQGVLGFFFLQCALAWGGDANNGQDQTEIQKRLTSQFTLTQPTADKSDIATAGAVLILHKDGLLMYGVSNPLPPQSTYKKGKITRNVWGKNWLREVGNQMANQTPDIVQRNFVAGETFWVTKVDVKGDGVVFGLYSNPYDGVRYFGELKFPFSKGRVPPADDVLENIEEVLTVQPADISSPSNAPPENAPSRIVPPAPPADSFLDTAPSSDQESSPVDLREGQTPQEVEKVLGKPTDTMTLKGSLIYIYPTVKVIFENGKLVDVQYQQK